MSRGSERRVQLLAGALLLALAAGTGLAADQPQWGQRFSRNMVSDETGLPETFDPATGANVKWSVRLGSETHSVPVVAGGRVFIGTNNDTPRDPRHEGDYGVMWCLDEKDGRFCWQLIVPKLPGDPFLDWPSGGIVSPPTVEGDRVYVVSNRGEVLCLDIHGQTNGNDGPYQDEGQHMARQGKPALDVTAIDADILWCFDLVSGAGVYPHDAAYCSILLDGPFLYVNTSNGVDNTHRRIRNPEAPALVVLDKATGRLLARDREGMSPRTFHCTWSSPSLGEVNGRRLVFFGGPDGVCYAFEPLQAAPPEGEVATLQCVWRFDCDPTAPKENVHEYVRNRKVSPSNIKGMPVFHNNRIYVAAGGDVWWGKNQAWLKCIDATRSGDVTQTAEVWSVPVQEHCCSTPSIHNGLVFLSDCGGIVYCLDADTGKTYWTHDTRGEMWGSTLVADGKVYVGTRRSQLWVFAADREKRVLSTVKLDSRMNSTPVAANGVLYVATMSRLYAVVKGAP